MIIIWAGSFDGGEDDGNSIVGALLLLLLLQNDNFDDIIHGRINSDGDTYDRANYNFGDGGGEGG